MPKARRRLRSGALRATTLAGAALAAWIASGAGAAERAIPVFQDCAVCPLMVTVPGGRGVVGSPADEPGRHAREALPHPVEVGAFAVSETEITRAQFAAFVADTGRQISPGCHTFGDGKDSTSDLDAQASWRAPGFEQTDDHPVICVTWEDARDYAAWLSRRSGRSYRLPTAVEWEYAARAGTTTQYFWGDDADAGCAFMNGGDRSLVRAVPVWEATVRHDREAGEPGARIIGCDDGVAFTAAAGRYRPNAFGLHDVAGNVWEWVGDCHDGATPGPTADLACSRRGVRGGSWDDWPMDLRSADLHRVEPGTRRTDLGFRVASDAPRR